MRVVGVRCTKDKLDWAVVDGDDRSSASVVEHKQVSVPDGERGDQLAWVRREVLELIERHRPSAAAVRVAEGQGARLAGRCEVEGVVQEAFASGRLVPTRHVAASIRSAYKARNNAELIPALDAIPAIKATAASRKEPVISAVALLPRG